MWIIRHLRARRILRDLEDMAEERAWDAYQRGAQPAVGAAWHGHVRVTVAPSAAINLTVTRYKINGFSVTRRQAIRALAKMLETPLAARRR